MKDHKKIGVTWDKIIEKVVHVGLLYLDYVYQ